MAVPPRVLQPSSAVGRAWDLEDDGLVTLAHADADVADVAETVWRGRSAGRLVDWSWRQIVLQSQEAFALTRPDGHPVALWATERDKLLALPGLGSCYRLDFLEIDPGLRGGVLGYYCVAVVCVRALEAGAENVVLASLPESRPFWEGTIGATFGRIHGWHVPGTLLSCRLDRTVMENLRRDADACQGPENRSSSP